MDAYQPPSPEGVPFAETSGVYLQVVDHDHVFANLTREPVLLNDFDTTDPLQEETLDRLLYSHYQRTETIDAAASCDCGRVHGVYRLGIVCQVCKVACQGTTDRNIESTVWFKAPDGIAALFNPAVWTILNNALRTAEVNILNYLTDTTVKFDIETIRSKETHRKLTRLLGFNPPRGWNNFIEHFDTIMDFMFEANIVNSNRQIRRELQEFLAANRNKLFPKYLPLPSKMCLVVETVSTTVYIDKSISEVMDAVLTITSIRRHQRRMQGETIQNRTAAAIRSLASFYDTHASKRLTGRSGLFRNHIFGSRLNFTGRGVISSISDPHEFDEIHIPWGMGVQLFKYHLLNKLLKRGYSVNEGLHLLYTNVLKFHPLVDELFTEIFNEAPGKFISVMLQRNRVYV